MNINVDQAMTIAAGIGLVLLVPTLIALVFYAVAFVLYGVILAIASTCEFMGQVKDTVKKIYSVVKDYLTTRNMIQ
jgi:hypothetical protein